MASINNLGSLDMILCQIFDLALCSVIYHRHIVRIENNTPIELLIFIFVSFF